MEAGPRIEADYQLEFREFYHALRWNTWRKSWWVYCLLIFSVAAVLLRTVLRLDGGTFTSQLIANLPELIFPVFLTGLFYWSVYRTAQRQFKTNDSLRQARHFIFSKEGLENSSPSSSGKAAWTVLHRVLETPESFLFFTSNATFGVFPKRSLKNEEQIQALRNLIRQHLGAKAKLKRGESD
jgi:hypothetical protein